MNPAAWRRETGDALELAVHVQPGAKRTDIAGLHGMALKVRLAAPPVDGKANAALRRFFADAFGVPLQRVSILRGESSRHKLLRIEAPTARPDREWALDPDRLAGTGETSAPPVTGRR